MAGPDEFGDQDGIGDGDDFSGLEAWAAEARAREAADARVRERWLRTQAEEGARFTAVLAGLVERGGTVTVMTVAGRALAGRIGAVGADFVALALPGGRRTLLALHAVAWVQAAPSRRRAGAPDAGLGDREIDEDAPAAAALVDVLAQAAADRPRVAVQTASAAVIGELRSVGLDVVALATAGDQPSLAYVRLDSVYEISFLDSG